MPVRRSVRNPKARLILMTAERREAGYRGQNPRLQPRPHKRRYAQTNTPLSYVGRRLNYALQNGSDTLTVRQERQLRRMSTRQLAREAKTDA